MLITNASRPSEEVRRQLDRLGVPRDCFDDLISRRRTGAARNRRARADRRSTTWGPHATTVCSGRPRGCLGAPIMRVGPEAADYVVCTGLVDERNETPSTTTTNSSRR